ncbi:Acid-sensing ion channel 1 [Holothuria leucospilota]|uniref:Acid-sensing ion channel 1 n=1 Tax=Holothuria leucospilota TaxID=206669 RepID=A0A9Q1BL83_HOLLE|nr:Acid-sensing ion channel 1 [Holothuria leucospilota]
MTLCNINLMRLSFLEDEERLKSADHRLLKTVMENFYGFRSPGIPTGGFQFASLDLNQLRGLNATIFIEEGAHKIHEMLIACTWKETECNETIFKARWTNFGYCYTFNEPNSGEPDDVTKPGRHEQLSLALNVQQNEYSGGGMNGAVGFVVMLHEQDDVPLVYDLGFLASPGFLTQVAIKKKVVR